MTEPIVDLQNAYDQLCQRIEPSNIKCSFLTVPEDNGSPHVEFVGGEYHYVVTERGLETQHRSTTDINEILYWLLYDLTFWMGVKYELDNRIEGPDCRRVIFARQLELMKRADTAMAGRLEKQIAVTLAANPFIDRY